MDQIIPEAYYTFDASLKTITLSNPYDAVEIAQIKKIKDLDTTEVLYDRELNDEPISLSTGVITHTHSSSSKDQTDSDKLLIIIESGSSSGISPYSAAAANGIILTDSSNIELTEANAQGKNDKLYKIAQTGAGLVYFYIDVNGTVSYKIAGIFLSVDASVTLAGTVQYYRDGTWVDNPAYDFSFTITEAQKMNGLYPFEEVHHRFPKRLKCTVSETCNIYAQVLTL